MKTKRKPDKYDRQIAMLRLNPDEIYSEWSSNVGLFATLPGLNVGCLTQIKSGRFLGPNAAITEAVKRDKDIPAHPGLIFLKHLPRFAYWQRKIDRMGLRK